MAEHEHPNVTTLRKRFRRRDNLVDFVDGLIETEVFPYPSGQRVLIPAIHVPVQTVTWKPEALHELTSLTIVDVKLVLNGTEKHVNVNLTLTPEDGVGAYELDYEVVKEEATDSFRLMSLSDIERVRMAMWGRYDWVKEKLEYINRLRLQISNDGEELEDGMSDEGNDHDNSDTSLQELEADEEGTMSEEVDPFDSVSTLQYSVARICGRSLIHRTTTLSQATYLGTILV